MSSPAAMAAHRAAAPDMRLRAISSILLLLAVPSSSAGVPCYRRATPTTSATVRCRRIRRSPSRTSSRARWRRRSRWRMPPRSTARSSSRCRPPAPMRELAAYQRQRVLQHCATRFAARAEELAMALCIEAGKPIQDARGEVGRLIDTFRIAAEESVRITGEVLPLDISPRARDYTGMWKRVPIGPCSFISPFNFPLNLAAHKVAPAIAAGCPFVLEAREPHAGGRADHRRGARRDRAAGGRLLDPAGAARAGRSLRDRRAAQAALASPARRRSAGRSRRRPATRRWCSSWAATPP